MRSCPASSLISCGSMPAKTTERSNISREFAHDVEIDLSIPSLQWCPTSATDVCSSWETPFSTVPSFGECGQYVAEAPVPVVRVSSTRRVLGGAGNTAANIVSLGGHATLISLVGSDDGGATLRRCASEAGVDLRAVDNTTSTLGKARVVGQHQRMRRNFNRSVGLSIRRASPRFSTSSTPRSVTATSSSSRTTRRASSPCALAQAIIRRAHGRG